MSTNFKLGLGIIVIAILALVTFVWYPGYKLKKEEQAKMVLNDKTVELDYLILRDHDCPSVVVKATEFLKTNSENVEHIWSVLGSCQFDLGKFDDAKVSFNKVQALDPENVAAKNYLKQMEFHTEEIVVTSRKIPFDKNEFELRMGLNFDTTLTFIESVNRPSNIPEYLLAEYTATKSFNETVSYLKNLLKQTNIVFTFSGSNGNAIIAYGNVKERQIITIEKTKDSKVKIEMNYQKLTD